MHLNPIEHAAMHEGRAAMRADAAAYAHQRLFLAAVDALTNDPTKLLEVPGYIDRGEWAAHEVVADWACGDPRILVDALRVIGQASKSADPGVRLAAQAWISGMARKHADFHCDDAEA